MWIFIGKNNQQKNSLTWYDLNWNYIFPLNAKHVLFFVLFFNFHFDFSRVLTRPGHDICEKKSKYFDKKKTNVKTSLASPTASKHFLKIIYSPPIKESKCPELLCASYLTLQKFGMWDQINCQEKRFKICHI